MVGEDTTIRKTQTPALAHLQVGVLTDTQTQTKPTLQVGACLPKGKVLTDLNTNSNKSTIKFPGF